MEKEGERERSQYFSGETGENTEFSKSERFA